MKDKFSDPVVPALASAESDPTTKIAPAAKTNLNSNQERDVLDESVRLHEVPINSLPKCARCGSLLRPGVVWFGEELPQDTMGEIDDLITQAPKIDLIMVIGTSASVYPAAGHVEVARSKGASVAVINTDDDVLTTMALQHVDWFFPGDAAVLLPELLRPVIGEMADTEEQS